MPPCVSLKYFFQHLTVYEFSHGREDICQRHNLKQFVAVFFSLQSHKTISKQKQRVMIFILLNKTNKLFEFMSLSSTSLLFHCHLHVLCYFIVICMSFVISLSSACPVLSLKNDQVSLVIIMSQTNDNMLTMKR